MARHMLLLIRFLSSCSSPTIDIEPSQLLLPGVFSFPHQRPADLDHKLLTCFTQLPPLFSSHLVNTAVKPGKLKKREYARGEKLLLGFVLGGEPFSTSPRSLGLPASRSPWLLVLNLPLLPASRISLL